MVTPADHANTVRGGFAHVKNGTIIVPDPEKCGASAALDALQAQAEDNTAAIEAVEAEVRKQERHVDTLLKRAEGAESALVAQAARADAAVQAAEALKAKLDEKWAERDIAMKAAEQADAETKRVIKDSGLVISRVRDRAEAAEQAAEQARNALQQLRDRADREPLAVDISDYSDEYCEGFLAGQANALDAAIARAALAGNQP